MSAKLNSNNEDKIVKSDEEIDLTNPLDVVHYPLWLEFKEKAPGTYKHSQSIINIVDSVSADVDGIDAQALQLAAMYHDIGKMWGPVIFTENQDKTNIHDELDPATSYHLLTKHVSDTAIILIMNNFPMKVINIAIQHHGNTVLKSIYEKAKKENDKISEDLFRYKTQRPNSLEALILMVCDQIEATSRSIYVDHQKEIDPVVFVNSVFNKLMMDGQFDNVQTALGNLNKIQKALVKDVAGNFHKRIKYDEDDAVMEDKT